MLPGAVRRTAFLLVVALLVAAAWGLGRLSASPGRRHVVVHAPIPGIVVVCLDTLRADAVTPAPGSPGLPGLEAWAATATRFDDAIASSSWTGPSIATLLTGLDPWNHGFVEVAPGTRLAAGVPTLAARFARAGWWTAAVTGGGWVSRASGLSNGFETASEDFDAEDPRVVIERWNGARPKDRPFFLFLHTYAPHDPYGDKSAAARERCDASHGADVARLVNALDAPGAGPAPVDLGAAFLAARLADPCRHDALVRAIGAPRAEALLGRYAAWLDGAWRDAPGGPALVTELKQAYLRSLRFVDGRLRRTLEAVDALPAGTVVVVCSDHGEAFGEHGPLHHGRHLTPELVRAVLVVRAPGWPAGRVAATCGLVDVAPTLLELAGLPIDAGFDGTSLSARVRGEGVGRPVPSLVAAPAAGPGAPDLRRVSVRDAGLAWTATFDLATGAWRDEAWFDRRRDPGEVAPADLAGIRSSAFDAAQREVRDAVLDRYRLWTTGSDSGR